MRPTFHLTPRDRWLAAAAQPSEPFGAPSLADEGFVHCTDGVEAMVTTANRFYRDVPGDFLVLTVDLDACTNPWRFDEPGKPFPHIYGPIDRAAILAVTPIPRDSAGRFEPFDSGIGSNPNEKDLLPGPDR